MSMRVFVLNTGRCGSVTFIRACQHIDNFTAGHETLAALAGPARFDYPDHHIEADNRLAWFLGHFESFIRPGDRFVWLRRDPDEVTESFLRRWDSTYRAGIIKAFAYGILMQGREWSPEDRRQVTRFYVDTVEANIGAFLRDKDHLVCDLATAEADFASFWAWIGAQGDRDAALSEWSTRHNASI